MTEWWEGRMVAFEANGDASTVASFEKDGCESSWVEVLVMGIMSSPFQCPRLMMTDRV